MDGNRQYPNGSEGFRGTRSYFLKSEFPNLECPHRDNGRSLALPAYPLPQATRSTINSGIAGRFGARR